MGNNDSLAGNVTGVGEIREVRGSGSRSERSERSNSKKPSRGAPPSSLSLPFSTDRSRSSSPSKANRIPSCPTSKESSPSKTPQNLPSTRPATASFFNSFNEAGSSQRGRPEGRGRASSLRHHQFLPRSTTVTSSGPSTFQPRLPISKFPASSSSY